MIKTLNLRSLLTFLPALFLLTVLTFAIVYARSTGISGRTLKSGTNGCSCHGSADLNTIVTINGPVQVQKGQTATYSVTVANPVKTGAGVDISVRSGTLGVQSALTKVLNFEIVNSSEIPMTAGSATVYFSYTAPAFVTSDTIFFTGNATNSSGSTAGDGWNFGQSFRVNVVEPLKILSLKTFVEGLYDVNSTNMIPDSATVILRQSTPPYTIAGSSSTILDNQGSGSFEFMNLSDGTPYYIVVMHRNSIETWSAQPQTFTTGYLQYDFSTSATQAYGGNLEQTGFVWAVYSGDVNQDGAVDATDVSMIDNDASNFVSGRTITDLTGDEFVDGSDFSISDNNASNYVSMIRP